jgi:type II secretory ATPase GspE/PulE/Tfp pilus assembly ATPase PilB-like protein
MIEFSLPEYPELFSGDLTEDEQLAIMPVTTGSNRNVEALLLRVFAYAVEMKASDVHICGHDWQGFYVDFGIRTTTGMVNYRFEGESNVNHVRSKMMQLTNLPQGGSTPDLADLRFSMIFPAWWAKQKGLKTVGDEPYDIDLRVAYARSFDGWAFTCRLVNQQAAPRLQELGLPYALEALIRRSISEPSGLILVTGPTGSGKSTLLNAMIRELINGQNVIKTIENPVEYRLRGPGPITQLQVHGTVTFPAALRSLLRQDPDIILIGEIRDVETMEVALDAANTGHLVLSTLHANSATDGISRALDLLPDRHRDSVRLAEALKLIMAQRLIHKFESQMAQRELGIYEKSWLEDNGLAVTRPLYETVSTNKLGKTAVVEAIEIDYPVSQVIRADTFDTGAVYKLASQQLQYETLVMAGLRAVEDGYAKLSDCKTKLETNRAAGVAPPLRTQLAEKYGLQYKDVARAIDQHVVNQERNERSNLEDVFERMFVK